MINLEREHISTREELEKVCRPLKDIVGFIKEFANPINAKVNYSSYHHDWPVIETRLKSQFSEKKKCFIDKLILLTISDYNYPPIYELRLVVSNSYGPKEFFAFIPGLSKKWNSWIRYRWEKTIGSFQIPIDKSKLSLLLEEAVKILTNFDESELKDVTES